jgi:hypothetical protein
VKKPAHSCRQCGSEIGHLHDCPLSGARRALVVSLNDLDVHALLQHVERVEALTRAIRRMLDAPKLRDRR